MHQIPQFLIFLTHHLTPTEFQSNQRKECGLERSLLHRIIVSELRPRPFKLDISWVLVMVWRPVGRNLRPPGATPDDHSQASCGETTENPFKPKLNWNTLNSEGKRELLWARARLPTKRVLSHLSSQTGKIENDCAKSFAFLGAWHSLKRARWKPPVTLYSYKDKLKIIEQDSFFEKR